MPRIELFKLVDGEIQFDRIELLLIPAFKEIIRRDQGSPGDTQARKKLFAFKEFHYLYLIADYQSFCNMHGHDDNEAHVYAVTEADLPEDYKPDLSVRSAIRKYKDEQYDISREFINQLRIIFKGSLIRIGRMRTSIDHAFSGGNLTEEQVEKVIKMQQDLFDIAAALPEQITRLNNAEKELDKLQETKQKIRGGEDIPSSANPETTLGHEQ